MQKTLQQLFEEYINECQYSRGLRFKTIVGYKVALGHFISIMPEVTTPQLLTVEMLNEFFKRIQTRQRIVGRDIIKIGLEDSTVKAYSNKLNSFFVWLIQRRFITDNPLDYIKLRHPEYKDKRALEEEEIQKIFAAVTLHSQNPLILRRNTAMVSLLFFCGLRLNEFISLKVTDIDIEKQMLTVRAETSKSKRTRYIPMHPTLILHLKEYIKERNKEKYRTEYLIVSTTHDKGLTCYGLKHWVNALGQASGVKFHLHRFRHSFACTLAKNNVTTIKIQRLMGHADPRMTATYLRSITIEDCRDDINKMSI